MSRFPNRTVEGAPEGSRPLLQKIAQSSPTGRSLNVHAQMRMHRRTATISYTCGRITPDVAVPLQSLRR